MSNNPRVDAFASKPRGLGTGYYQALELARAIEDDLNAVVTGVLGLVERCEQLDTKEELPEEIDGQLIFNARIAIREGALRGAIPVPLLQDKLDELAHDAALYISEVDGLRQCGCCKRILSNGGHHQLSCPIATIGELLRLAKPFIKARINTEVFYEATRFAIKPTDGERFNVHIEQAQSADKKFWMVHRGIQALTKTGEWETHPIVNEMLADFYERTGFDSFDAAYNCYCDHGRKGT